MTNGYVGKLLFVDLTTGAITEETRDDAFYRKWLGGAGLAVATILERTKAGIDPLGGENMLAFSTGPLTGTGVYGGGRYTVACKSPLTGAWADSNSGGTWGPELKFAGYDGLFISGAAAEPVCIVIDRGQPSIVPAGDLWGLDTYETEDALKAKLGDPHSWTITCIGPAGEKLSLLAGIVNEKGRIAARSGVGAVMGSKMLKAVAVRGRKGARLPAADKEGLKEIQKRYLEELKASPFHQGLTAAGTGGATSFLLSIGDCPADNFGSTGTDSMPTCDNLDAAKMDIYKLKSYGCHTCPIRCGALIQIKEGPFATADEVHRPEYETLAAIGPNCRNDVVEAIVKGNDICNRYGIDTMGVGSSVAFAIECYEKGLIDKNDTGGLEPTWGDPQALVALIEQIARREGFGALLADGATRAAEKIGKGSEEYAMCVAGRAVPFHDPRMNPAHGCHYIADAQPANHLGPAPMAVLDGGAALGPDPLLQSDSATMFGDYDKKGDIYARGCAYYQLLSSGGLCALYCQFYNPPVVELLRPVTGWDMDWAEGLETAKRILTARHAFNAREGVNIGDAFQLPKRFQVPLVAGPAAGGTPPPYEVLREGYFEAMGWDRKTGWPTKETLARLGVDAA
jgi:aldehyde:ferredoxin oxidoreductase